MDDEEYMRSYRPPFIGRAYYSEEGESIAAGTAESPAGSGESAAVLR